MITQTITKCECGSDQFVLMVQRGYDGLLKSDGSLNVSNGTDDEIRFIACDSCEKEYESKNFDQIYID